MINLIKENKNNLAYHKQYLHDVMDRNGLNDENDIELFIKEIQRSLNVVRTSFK